MYGEGKSSSKTSSEHRAVTSVESTRFYVLGVFSALGFTQALVWNTWGPISGSAERVFVDWEDSTIALLSNWGPITYMVSTVFFAWLLDEKGLRVGLLLAALLMALGCGVRCLAEVPNAPLLIHVGQILNGLAGPVCMGGPPLVAATWFPQQERIAATAVGTVASGLGVAVSFILPPLMVPAPPLSTGSDEVASAKEIADNIMYLLKAEFAWCALILAAIILHLPSKPRVAPSVTATVQRVQFSHAVSQLLRNGLFWQLGAPYALSCGIYAAWCTVYYVNVKPLGISEVSAGWVAFWSMLVAQVVGLVLSIFADMFGGRMKQMIVGLYSVAAAAFFIFTLMYVDVLPYSKGLLYVTNVLGGAAIAGAPPLLYALVCEATFPIAEGITNLFMTCLNNMAGMLFLLLPMLLSGTAWMNWLLTITVAMCIPVFSSFPELSTPVKII